MSPRKLRLVRVEDGKIFGAVAGPGFPLEADKIISRWSGFLAGLQCAERAPCSAIPAGVNARVPFWKESGPRTDTNDAPIRKVQSHDQQR
jgi:hypothetical protein